MWKIIVIVFFIFGNSFADFDANQAREISKGNMVTGYNEKQFKEIEERIKEEASKGRKSVSFDNQHKLYEYVHAFRGVLEKKGFKVVDIDYKELQCTFVCYGVVVSWERRGKK